MTRPVIDPAGGPKLVMPRGYHLVTFVSTAMLVAGIGLAWVGLLLAAAGGVLAYIEFRELLRLNPWIMREGDEDWPLLAPGPQRLSTISAVVLLIGCGAALAAVQVGDEAWLALPPAIVTGFAMVAFNGPTFRALEDAARELGSGR